MTLRSVCAVGAAAGLSLVALHGQQRATFRASTTRVGVDVAVRRGNTPATGLTAADFTLTDNGAKQSVEVVSISEIPLDVSLVVDVSGSTSSQVDQYRADIKGLAAELRPIDRLRVLTFGSDFQEVAPFAPPNALGSLDAIDTRGFSSIYDGISAALMHQPALGRRHLIVVFTDGDENKSIVDGDALVALAQRSEGTLHLIAPPRPITAQTTLALPIIREFGDRPQTAAPQPYAAGGAGSVIASGRGATSADGSPRSTGTQVKAEQGTALKLDEVGRLQRAIDENGGQVHIGSSFVPDFKLVFRDFVSSYVLFYEPTKVSDKGWHTLKVTVKGATVRARRGYFAGNGR
jgi:VWFA-related protein